MSYLAHDKNDLGVSTSDHLHALNQLKEKANEYQLKFWNFV